MKTPQRTFVVEFKSPRRQQKARTNSIWGDTDLKALAREVEGQASDLAYSPKTEIVLGTNTVDLPPVDMGSVAETAGIVDAAQIEQLSGDDLKTDELPRRSSEHTDVDPEVVAAEALNIQAPLDTPEPLGIPEPQTISKLAAIKRSGRRQRSTSPGTLAQTAPAAVYTEPGLDEIAALDAENKRLKLLLVEHLRDQNMRLEQMLERFALS
ncbi:hypothetical protein Amn_pb02270 (plasmid) [Aminobacter sp. Y103A]|uniref:hypothetical protein n=1 Tax=Aminobacter sp. Y103A TaxID=1870862 RepID=UPI002572ACD6|nr:hypothetical protein [Aminobacter sp. SS-2016]BBD41236.1 hypothetical protein Amn_pb02270 [Aminobacter sp. SS-2016]